MRTATVVLADSHLLVAQGLRLILEAQPELRILDAVTEGFEALEQLAASTARTC